MSKDARDLEHRIREANHRADRFHHKMVLMLRWGFGATLVGSGCVMNHAVLSGSFFMYAFGVVFALASLAGLYLWCNVAS